MALLESSTAEWLTPQDWYTLVKAVLSEGDFLLWKSEYYDACKETAKHNILVNNGLTFDALVREGHFGQDAQGMYDPGLYAQIQLAALMAWRKLPAKGESGSSLSGIRQGPDEPFQEFVNQLLTTASQIFSNLSMSNNWLLRMLMQPVKQLLGLIIKKIDLSGYISLCADIGPSFHQGIAVAAALKDMTIHEWFEHKQKKSGKGCFKCGLEGHFAHNCPGSNNIQKGPCVPGICPRCHHGNHWRNECHSKKDDKCTPVVPQGNGSRASPGPQILPSNFTGPV